MREIKTDNMPAQGTLDWHRARLGHWTGSTIYELMKRSTAQRKGEDFGETAKTRIIKTISERHLQFRAIEDDDVFDLYLEHTAAHSKAMEWGAEHEFEARNLYQEVVGAEVVECGSVEHKTIPFYAASPDGLVYDVDRVIEIKCPLPQTAFKYQCLIHDAKTLKKVEPKYYWQVQAELDCTEATSCDFIVYSPFLDRPLFIVNIEPDKEDIKEIHERIALAEQWATNHLVKN